MASPFDILGALSFVQGAITVVFATILAFRAYTEQVRISLYHEYLKGISYL